MSQVRQRTLAEALRAARTNAGSTPAPSTHGSGGGSQSPHSSSPSPARRRIVSTASIRSKPASTRLSPTAFDYFNDPAVLVSTPVEEGRESEYAEHLSYAFNYSAVLVTILKSGSYKEKTGVSIDGDDPDTEYEVEGVPDPDVDRFWVKLRARATVIDETLDPTPQLAIIRSLGDKHARLHPDYGENKRVADLCLCLRVRTTWREESAYATLSHTPQAPGGGYRPKAANDRPPSANAFGSGSSYAVKPVGKWAAQPPGSLVKKWVGTGFPCLVCFSMWALTDNHADTKGICPFMCKEAFGPDRAPDSAQPAGSRPAPPSAATIAHLASPAAEQVPTDDVVVLGAPNPEPVASFQTVIADLDPPDATSHEGGLDAEDSTVVDGMTPAAFASAVHADEDFDFPALREPKSWQLPIICAAAASSLQFQ
ncbi:hypothetical protein CYMTET_19138 [Cymbomonas tetramitiformis]|uniref:Uncharacterized protein n=1 Tax=Cymbomonas tetramitiformis TaxID=36881 RepID=A0AAE0G6L9_9CHLO|nr:hypothetical protein CYMTET_19138 [Cymbomonas tetramitiformis]